MEWDNIRNTTPPFIPEYSSPTDTRNFDPIEEEDDGLPRGHYVGLVCSICPWALALITCTHTHTHTHTRAHTHAHTQADPIASNKMTALTVHLPFVGFTYTNNSVISDNPPSSHTDTNGGTCVFSAA